MLTKSECTIFLIYMLLLAPVKGWLWQRKTKTKCYELVGCFSNKKPFTNAFRKLPSSPTEINVEFLFYTADDVNQATVINYKTQAIQIAESGFNNALPTKFIIHGYKSRGRKHWYQSIKDELLKKEPMNVFVVDWQKGSMISDYFKAAANTRVVGALIANFIKELVDQKAADVSTVHLIGHSLGSHIAGHAGARLDRLGRITGLDPASLSFEKYGTAVRLDKSDANFVDVIHTDAEPLVNLGFGAEKAMGHVDFYPNKGRNQPGCKKNNWKNVDNFLSTGEDGPLACSHMRAIQLFRDSINNCVFYGRKCADVDAAVDGDCNREEDPDVVMGLGTTPDTRGVYIVDTNSVTPFCK